MKDWSYTDDNGNHLVIGPCDDDRPGCVHLDAPDGVVRVAPEDRGLVTGKLHQAAGLPAPAILERPQNPDVYLSLLNGMSFEVRSGKVDITRHATPGRSGTLLEPVVIRGIAAALAVRADEAERQPEPDPADVDELAMVLAEGNGAIGLDGARPLALRILRAGYRREARDG